VIKSFWEALAEKFGRAARTGLVIGALGILLITGLAGYWLLRTEYQVLFADLTPQDTAAMAAELDRQKIPYTLSDQGNNVATILVDKTEVHKTRIKLMGKEIPLHGTVGFELFNNSDFGMTEFAQKINYQRALQGELTRTILSLAEIRDARVLLALPEQGLFKQAINRPKASVTLTMKQGQSLRQEQVIGIQRLVSAAVPGIVAQDVTIVDQTGVALTRMGDSESDSGGVGYSRLDLKKDTEKYLSRKAMEVLERALGRGQAMASVDVTLDMDKVQSNTDEVLSSSGSPEEAPSGVLVRRRENVREADAPVTANAAAGVGKATHGGSNQSEVEYVVGHRVEQVIGQPGSIRRIQIAVVVHQSLSPEQKENLVAMVAATVGASPERGDSVVVQTLDSLKAPAPAPEGTEPAANGTVSGTGPVLIPSVPSRAEAPVNSWVPRFRVAGMVPFVVLLMLTFTVWLLFRRRTGGAASRSDSAEALTEEERQAALLQVQRWMHGQGSATRAGAIPPSAPTTGKPSGNQAFPGSTPR